MRYGVENTESVHHLGYTVGIGNGDNMVIVHVPKQSLKEKVKGTTEKGGETYGDRTIQSERGRSNGERG
jgi:hypothetical protein